MKKIDTKLLRIKKVLDFAGNNRHSSFYKDKYKKAGINLIKDINSVEDFKKLPFLTKDEIVNSDPFGRFFLPWREFGSVSISSGTTSSPDSLSIILASRQRFKKPNESFGPISAIRLLPPTHQGRDLIKPSLTVKGTMGVGTVVGDINNLPLCAKIAARLRINTVVTSPTILYFFMPYLQKEYCLDDIRKIVLIGEYCSKQKAILFRKMFKNSEFVRSYGMSEAQGESIGIGCRFLDSLTTNYFHPSPKFYCETIDSGEEDELVITHLYKNGFPLIRYRTGDAVKLENFDCPCGDNQRMKILGRINYDFFKAYGVIIYAELIDKALAAYANYLDSPDWQLHIYEKLISGKIVPRFKLQLILNRDLTGEVKETEKMLAAGVSERLFLSAKKTLASLVAEGFFLPLEVEFVKSFSTASNSAKPRRIVPHLD